MGEFVLQALNITKRFPGVIANENVNIQVRKSEIHGLIGENGAGKSTLLKIFNGIYPAGTFEGEIRLDGKKVEFSSPYDAMLKGIGFVPQEINVLDNLTVAENLFVGNMTPGGKTKVIINFKDIYKKTVDLLEMNNLFIDPMIKVRMHAKYWSKAVINGCKGTIKRSKGVDS